MTKHIWAFGLLGAVGLWVGSQSAEAQELFKVGRSIEASTKTMELTGDADTVQVRGFGRYPTYYYWYPQPYYYPVYYYPQYYPQYYYPAPVYQPATAYYYWQSPTVTWGYYYRQTPPAPPPPAYQPPAYQPVPTTVQMPCPECPDPCQQIPARTVVVRQGAFAYGTTAPYGAEPPMAYPQQQQQPQYQQPPLPQLQYQQPQQQPRQQQPQGQRQQQPQGQQRNPGYDYDGGPMNPVPMPKDEQDPNKARNANTIMTSAQGSGTLRYARYGEPAPTSPKSEPGKYPAYGERR